MEDDLALLGWRQKPPCVERASYRVDEERGRTRRPPTPHWPAALAARCPTHHAARPRRAALAPTSSRPATIATPPTQSGTARRVSTDAWNSPTRMTLRSEP